MNKKRACFFGLTFSFALGLHMSGYSKTLHHWDFEKNHEEFVVPTGLPGVSPADCRLTQKQVFQGQGALACRYTILPKHAFVVARHLKIPAARQVELDFYIKSLRSPQYFLTLQEEDGSAYNYVLELETVNQWQHVRVSSNDFVLAQDKVDENGRLDISQVKLLLISDWSGVLASKAIKTAVLLDQFKLNYE